LPFDLDTTELSQYKNVKENWNSWEKVEKQCQMVAVNIMELCSPAQEEAKKTSSPS
jgi:hypothetical protein